MATDKVVTPVFRASYVKLTTPGIDSKGRKQYEITMIINLEDVNTHPFQEMKRIVADAIAEKWGNNPPKGLRSPFRKGESLDVNPLGYDLDKYPDYAGKIIVAARSIDIPPQVCDVNRTPIIDASEIYSGMYARASVTAFAYDTSGRKDEHGNVMATSRGVSFGLQNVQKIRDGEPLGRSRGPAEADFETFVEVAAPGNHADLLAGLGI